jgi:hypothetical protein
MSHDWGTIFGFDAFQHAKADQKHHLHKLLVDGDL